MARRQTRRRARPQPSQTWKWLTGGGLLFFCALVVGGLLYLKATTPERPTLAAETLCPVDGPFSKTIVLLDRSDNLPVLTKEEIRTFLLDLADTTPEFGLVELRLLSPEVAGGSVMFSKCNPGDGSNLSELVANPKLAKKRWKEGFQEPLESALREQLNESPSDTSPIIETIQHISVAQFSGRKAAEIPKNLIVISDMIEHGPEYSQYRGDLSFSTFKKAAAYKRLRTDLLGASVTIKYLVRLKSKIDSGQHIQFWNDWVSDSGGRLIEADKLQGAG